MMYNALYGLLRIKVVGLPGPHLVCVHVDRSATVRMLLYFKKYMCEGTACIFLRLVLPYQLRF